VEKGGGRLSRLPPFPFSIPPHANHFYFEFQAGRAEEAEEAEAADDDGVEEDIGTSVSVVAEAAVAL
jgi:hypothetical protein